MKGSRFRFRLRVIVAAQHGRLSAGTWFHDLIAASLHRCTGQRCRRAVGRGAERSGFRKRFPGGDVSLRLIAFYRLITD
jgi:hypothetical protein